MNMNKYTQKSLEALRDMQSAALENGNQQVEQLHLLYALRTVSRGSGQVFLKMSFASFSGEGSMELFT